MISDRVVQTLSSDRTVKRGGDGRRVCVLVLCISGAVNVRQNLNSWVLVSGKNIICK